MHIVYVYKILKVCTNVKENKSRLKKKKTVIIKDKKNYIAETLKTEEVPDQESNVQEVDL